MPQRRQSQGVMSPNMGLFLDRPPLLVPDGGLRDCRNIRVRDGRIERRSMGWGPFPTDEDALILPHPITGFYTFVTREQIRHLLIATTTDILEYVEATEEALFLTPRYEEGTVSTTEDSPTITGSGTEWEDNVKIGDYIRVGSTGMRDSQADWPRIIDVVSDTELTIDSDFPFTSSDEEYTIRQTFTGGLLHPWFFETFIAAEDLTEGDDGDRWYATNGIDKVVAWDGETDQVYVPDLGDITSAAWMRRFKNAMIYGQIRTDGNLQPTSIRVSALGKPEEVVDEGAAEFAVHDGTDPLLNGRAIGDMLAMYGNRTITLAQFIGGDLLFAFRQVTVDKGAVSGNGIADFGNFHEFVSTDAKYRFDGASVQERDQHVWRDFVRRLAPDRLAMLHHFFDDEEGELVWVVPLITDPPPEDEDLEVGPPTTAVVEHYLEHADPQDPTHRPITVRDLPSLAAGSYLRETGITWQEIEGTWEEQDSRWSDRSLEATFPFRLFGTVDGEVFILNSRDDKNGDPIRSHARTGRKQLGDIRRKGVIQRIYPFAQRVSGATYSLQVRVHFTEDPAGATSTGGTFQYDLTHADTSRHFVSPRLAGRFYEIEFFTDGDNRGWSLQGWDVDIVPAGER